MPTEAEIFEKTYVLLRKGLSRPCTCRHYDKPGVCGFCDGDGDEPGDVCERCPQCQGTGKCWQCEGTLTVVPDSLDETLNLALFVSWINGMRLSRDQENHARFYEQWEVLEAYVQRITQLSVESTTPEEMHEMVARMAAPEEPEDKTPNAGALSAEDLAALGVED